MSEIDRAEMAPLVGNLARDQAYYRMEWLPDQFPGRREGGELRAHPIYGAYVIKDYVRQLEARGQGGDREGLLRSLRTVCYASIARMERHEGAMVFWYPPSPTASRAYERHYSGLTQGYYAVYMAKAARLLRDSAIKEAAGAAFDALMVPADRGGVLYPGVLGPSIAEVPQQPNSLILNGWQSALACVSYYGATTNDPRANELLQSSAHEMARLLPQYDVNALSNSRYGLTGFVYLRLIVRGANPRDVTIRGIHMDVGDGRTHDVPVGTRVRWLNYVFDKDATVSTDGLHPNGRVVRMNVVMSRERFPEPNRLLFEAAMSRDAQFVLQINVGHYDPRTSAPARGDWVTIAELDRGAGRHDINVELPWNVADLVVYPTNFAKVIDGNPTNVYHRIHIDRLRELHSVTGISELREWAEVWEGYIGDWGRMSVYDGLFIRAPGGVVPVRPGTTARRTMLSSPRLKPVVKLGGRVKRWAEHL